MVMLKTHKKNALTTFGIALSFAIAIGGWGLTSRLIDIESNRILSGTTSFLVDIPPIDEAVMNEGAESIRLGLTENEIVSILQNWGLVENRRPHEPAVGQLDMEQAILAGRLGLEFLITHNILPTEMLNGSGARAILSQNVPQGGDFLPLRYSYWIVHFYDEEIDVHMTINAVTGQVWGIELFARQSSQVAVSPLIDLSINLDSLETVLTDFMLGLNIQPQGEIFLGPYLLWGDFFEEQTAVVPSLAPSFEVPTWETDRSSAVFIGNLLIALQGFAGENANAIITVSRGYLLDRTLYFDGINIRLSGVSWVTP